MRTVLLLRSSHHVGGIERQLLDHALRLQAEGWTPMLLCLYRGAGTHPLVATAQAKGVRAHSLSDASPFALSPLRSLRAWIQDLQPALLHCCDYRSDILAWWAVSGRPRLVESHGHTRESRGMVLWNRLDIWALRRAAAVVAVSTAWETRLASADIPTTKLHVVGNSRAILPDTPAPPPQPLPAPGPHLLYAGRLSPEKGIDILLAAWPDIQRRYPQAHLWVLGNSTNISALQRRLPEQEPQPHVHWLGYHPDIRPWLQAVSAVVAPSRQEAWGMTVFEALCAGKPVLATRVGGLPELCREAPHAHLVKPESPAALVAGVQKVLEPHFPQGAALGRAFKQQARFDPERRHEKLTALYNAILA